MSMARRATAGHAMLRLSEHGDGPPEPTHDVHAVDEDGESLFICASAWSEQEAENDLRRVLRDPKGWPEGVDDYEVRER